MSPTREVVETYEHILRRMMCVHCGDYSKPIFVQCKEGHVICSFCVGTKICRICGDLVAPYRIYVFDNIHNLMTFPCQFRRRGCNFRGKYPLLQHHLTECSLREYYCPLVNCYWRGEAEDIFRHFRDTHNNQRMVKLKADNVIKIIENEERRFIIKDLGIIFVVVFAFPYHAQFVQCYATNFDNSFNCIENFEVVFHIKLKAGRTFVGKVPCKQRLHTTPHWQHVVLNSMIDQNVDFIIEFKLREQYVLPPLG
ncbi:probable E3 ubiquitin-protein ligase sinah [Coccinella septempunctata]|uniref:probable E3 ubiquitin-protein ligase sinah n=1 Tax=Coccinella septempunctata TaxID=41139 RepID=UPI001D07BE72|nr:probable E3 ubiquitin-protein ligase sinah [Coccinella septempunctata]